MWNRVKLSEIASSVDYGHTAPSTNQPIGPRFLRITDIQDDQVDWETVPFCECSSTEENASKLEAGDIVFARTGATTGKSFLIKECPDRAIFASYLIRVRSNSGVLPDYLAHFFKTPEYWAQISLNARGAAQAGVNATVLKSLSVPLPPIAQQKRIAAILDKADELRSLRRRALEQLDAIAQSTFLEMFGDPEKNPKGWHVTAIGDLAEVETGGTPDRTNSDFYGGSIPWIKTGEVVNNVINSTEEFLTQFGLSSSNCRLFPVNTIIIAMYGQGLTRGRSAKLGIQATTNQACAAILPNSKFDPDYLWLLIQMSYQRLRNLGRGGNQPNLNLRLVKSFKVILPPLHLQQEFARRIEAIEQLKATHRESLAQFDALFASLQHRAFRGEL